MLFLQRHHEARWRDVGDHRRACQYHQPGEGQQQVVVQHARQQPQRYHGGAEGLGLCVLYSVTLLAMLFLQRHHEARWRDVGDFLEDRQQRDAVEDAQP
jgi:phosphohistidine phosphatase SixA